MLVFEKVIEITNFLQSQNGSVGFVPTMGALHQGHISLVEKAKSENSLVVSSIFVNPIQFNDKNDLHNYPRTLQADLAMLEKAGCDVVFVPSVEQVYPEQEVEGSYDFGLLDRTMEGSFRPGHFNGVAIVVKRLFEIVNPTRAYFGEKDFQQLAIIRRLVEILKLNIEIIGCPIVREKDGLAMSSRNLRLSAEERKKAVSISQTLFEAQRRSRTMSVPELKKWVDSSLQASSGLSAEYFEIVDPLTLQSISSWPNGQAVGCIAVRVGDIRLIDNISL